MADEPIHAFPHLGCSLVGEGHGENRIRSNSKVINEMRDSVSNDARLAGAGAGKDKNRSLDLLGGFSLLRIEFTEVQLSPVYRRRFIPREPRFTRGFRHRNLGSVPANARMHTKVMGIP